MKLSSSTASAAASRRRSPHLWPPRAVPSHACARAKPYPHRTPLAAIGCARPRLCVPTHARLCLLHLLPVAARPRARCRRVVVVALPPRSARLLASPLRVHAALVAPMALDLRLTAPPLPPHSRCLLACCCFAPWPLPLSHARARSLSPALLLLAAAVPLLLAAAA